MVQNYLDTIRGDVEEFIKTGRVEKAHELSQRTGHHFNWSSAPQHFVGKLDAKFVMMHLNPKQRDCFDDCYEGTLDWQNFEEYLSYHQSFGKIKYGSNSDRTHKSPFDQKQIRFLRAFNAIDFVTEKTPEDRYFNLERVIDQKLQLEIIPYGSDNFEASKMKKDIAPFLDVALDLIATCPRDYILFCGSVFNRIFSDSIKRTERFKLKKTDGSWTKAEYKFSVLSFSHKGTSIKAGLAHSYAMQGLPMVEYGKKCSELYRKYIS